METVSSLKVSDWWGKKYSSKMNLFLAGNSGIIDMQKEIGECSTLYVFSKNGKEIARFSQDHTFGFCTQAYGVEVKNIYGNGIKLING